MSRTRARVALLGAALAGAPACGTPAAESLHTSIRSEDCTPPPADVEAAFSARDLGVQQCPAPEGWRLLLVASDANTWLELRGPSISWSSERPVIYESPIGLFPSVGGVDTVEWRRTPGNQPSALIFRVTAQDPADPGAQRSALFVTRIEPDRACLLGRAATAGEARALADSSRRCPTPPAPA